MNSPSARDAPNSSAVTQELLPGGQSPAVGAAAPSGRQTSSLLDAILKPAGVVNDQLVNALERFLAETSPTKALICWLNLAAPSRSRLTQEQVVKLLDRDIARLDALLNRQVNAVMHHPRFQQLEASWRGLQYLVEPIDDVERIKIKVLNISWPDLSRDLDQALEFDQSQLFRKVYEEQFGTPGGQPFGVLLGDYEIHHQPSADHPVDDIATLGRIAQVAAASFAPFIAAAHPSLLGLESFDELERTSDLARHFEQLDYLQWRRLRDSEDSRFLGLVLPRILLRVPYEDDGTRLDGFGFREEVEERGRRRYLWGNAAYAFGAVVVRAFAERGWLANIRGVQRDPKLGVVGGGLVTGLPVHSFQTDKQGIAVKCSMDAVITDYQEKNLAELGFLPLCHCADTPQAAFYSSMSVQKPKRYDEPAATASARLSAMLNCLFCASRFAHYLKGMVRDKIGKYIGPAECEADLQSWLLQYTTATADEDPESAIKARHPLREARVQIREDLYIPGKYHCVIHLRPYFQLDQVVTTLKLTTELAPGMTG